MSAQLTTVHSDDGAWLMRFEADFDGIYPAEWIFLGIRSEPPIGIRNELERKAFNYFHERRSGAGDCDDFEDSPID